MNFFSSFLTLQLSDEISNKNESEDTCTGDNVEMEHHIWKTFEVSSRNEEEMFKYYSKGSHT